MRIGHYVPVLFEGQAPLGDNVEGEKKEQKETQSPSQAVLKNLETEEVAQMRKDMQTKLANVQKDIETKNSNIIQLQNQIAKLQAANVEQAKLNATQQQLLQAQQDLANKQFEYAKVTNDETKKIIAFQSKLVESQISIQKNMLPEKYRFLNESNIQNAKVYVDKLIKDDGMERIKGMVDFKKAFKDSDLLYGKDKEGGYFAVCVDQADFNKLADTLEEVGYLRDDILAVTLPQIFDRSNLTK